MSWISVVAAAGCGVAAGLIVKPVLRKRTSEKLHYALAWGALAGLLFAAVQWFITPQLEARYEASRLDETLSGNAAFSAIKKHDPQTYARIMSELKSGLLKGKSKAELTELVRTEVTGVVQKRLPRSSDDAATEYMRVMVQEMSELRSHGGELCYRFLFPKPGAVLDLTRYVSANTRDADFAALSQVVRSSTVSPQDVPTKAAVATRLQPVVAALAGRYGNDLSLLAQPELPGIDRDKLCSMNIDMYTVILQLPVTDSGPLIRYLMGQS